MYFAFDFSFVELNEKIFPNTALPLNSEFKNEIFANSPGSLVYANIPKMTPLHISIVWRRPLRRIDDVALRRWALFKVERLPLR